jgi:hypothetical protein
VKFKKKKNLPKKKKNISIQGWEDLSFCGELSFTLSFLFLYASYVAAYIFTAPTCKGTIISLEMLLFSISFPDLISYFMDTPERRVSGERRPKDRMTLQIILVFTLTPPKTFTRGRVSLFDKYLDWPHVNIKQIYTLQEDKCKCKKFGRVSVNHTLTQDLLTIYTAIDTYTYNTVPYPIINE